MKAPRTAILFLCALLIVSSSLSSPENGEAGLTLPILSASSGVSAQPGGNQVWTEYAGCSATNAPLANGDFEQQVVELVNAARAVQNPPLPPLKRVAALDDAARYHARDLGQDDYFAHDTYDRFNGTLTFVCAWYDRLASYYDGGYKGENIAGGFSTPQDVMNGWMNSPSHRAIILSGNYREVGVGYYEGSGTYLRYWAQDFGQRSEVYPLVVNGEAATTDSRNVRLYIYGNWQQMRLRNDAGEWSAWQPFQPTLEWTLDGGIGHRTVYAEMRSDATTVSSSDSIYLISEGAPVLGNLPNELNFVYSIPDRRLLPPSAEITPLNVGDSTALAWNAAPSGPPFTVSPSSGTAPSTIRITPAGFETGYPATYTGEITVTAASPEGTTGSPHRIGLRLSVVDRPIRSVYLPFVARDGSP